MKLVSKNFKITLTLPRLPLLLLMMLLTLPRLPLLLLPNLLPMILLLKRLKVRLNIKAVLIIGSNNMKGLTRS